VCGHRGVKAVSVAFNTLPIHTTRIWLAAGTTDMRKGFTGLSALVQSALESNPLCGHMFVFRWSCHSSFCSSMSGGFRPAEGGAQPLDAPETVHG
jgi:hypothetical protein